MEGNIGVEETNQLSSSSTAARVLNASDNRQPPGILMTHTSSVPLSASPTIITRGINFGARTAERTRMFANNISSAIEGIEPLIEQARLRSSVSLGSLLNIQRTQAQPRIPSSLSENAIAGVPSDSYVINFDERTPSDSFTDGSPQEHHHHQMTITNNPLNVILESDNEAMRNQNNNSNNNSNSDSSDEDTTEATQIRPGAAAFLKVYKRFIPFILILVAKGLYDHRVVVLNFVVLLFTFDYANTVLKREVTKQQNKSWTALLITTCYIIACIVFIDFEYEIHIFSSLYTKSLTVGELLWSVFVTDYVLKLITIIVKIAFTCLPMRLVELRKRAKYYFMIEATSQLYRAIMPIRPWLYYLLEAYHGTEKVVGIFLVVVYVSSKGNDFLSNVLLFHKAARKLFQDVSLGVSPSKEQIIESGGVCAICHEEYSTPVQLQCTHIFCEICLMTWLNRERSCPLCRDAITDHPAYGDGQTTNFVQFY